MHFKPIDEMSLRHLFSSSYAEDILKMSYLGPVLNASNTPETSPDCLILDRRERRWRIWRCEFKYIAGTKKDFEHNGEFDIAIVWSIPPTSDKHELQKELLSQNGCHEVIVLSEQKAFRELKEYRIPDSKEFDGIPELKKVLIESWKIKYPTVFAAYIAAKIYPKGFQMDKMVNVLSKEFEDVKKMLPKGRANVVSALLQTKTPLIRRMHGRTYCWTDTINADMAVREMEEIIRTRFRERMPSSEVVDWFKADG